MGWAQRRTAMRQRVNLSPTATARGRRGAGGGRGWPSAGQAGEVAGSGSATAVLGSTRSIQPGNHQFARPSSYMIAGTRTSRTMVASMKIALARPIPMSLRPTWSASANAPNTATMIAAAAVITRAVAARPSVTARDALAVRVVQLPDAADRRNTS